MLKPLRIYCYCNGICFFFYLSCCIFEEFTLKISFGISEDSSLPGRYLYLCIIIIKYRQVPKKISWWRIPYLDDMFLGVYYICGNRKYLSIDLTWFILYYVHVIHVFLLHITLLDIDFSYKYSRQLTLYYHQDKEYKHLSSLKDISPKRSSFWWHTQYESLSPSSAGQGPILRSC